MGCVDPQEGNRAKAVKSEPDKVISVKQDDKSVQDEEASNQLAEKS